MWGGGDLLQLNNFLIDYFNSESHYRIPVHKTQVKLNEDLIQQQAP